MLKARMITRNGLNRLAFMGLLVGGLAAGSAPADAAMYLRGYLSTVPSNWMTADDWKALQSAAQTLLGRNPAEPGQSENWQGPSGTKGTLTVKRVFAKSDMPCRALEGKFIDKAGTQTRDFTFNVCRVQSGDWKVAD